LHGQCFDISFVFFGFYCLLIGYLIFRSGFLPRILGAGMAIAGLGWLTFLSPPLAHDLSPGKFGFVYNHAKVVALQIVVGNVFHANLVVGVAGKSHKLWMAAVDGTGERNRGVPGSARIDGTIRGGDEGGDGEIH
jgi:Domain of unknown function (DUF4386)